MFTPDEKRELVRQGLKNDLYHILASSCIAVLEEVQLSFYEENKVTLMATDDPSGVRLFISVLEDIATHFRDCAVTIEQAALHNTSAKAQVEQALEQIVDELIRDGKI